MMKKNKEKKTDCVWKEEEKMDKRSSERPIRAALALEPRQRGSTWAPHHYHILIGDVGEKPSDLFTLLSFD